MSVEFDGISDGWEISAGFLDGDFEKTETTWNGRKIVIQSAGGRAGEIFQEQQISLAVIQELLQEDGLVFPLSGHDVTHLFPFEELFLDSEMDIMLAPAWDIDPNKQFMLAPVYSQDQIVRCGLRKFWKKHKTAILITAGAIVVVAGGAIAIAMLWPAAGTTAVGIGGTIASGLMNGDSSSDNSSSVPNNPHPSPGESPVNTTPPPLPSFVEALKDFYNNTKFDPPPPPPMDLHSILPSSQQTGTSFSISNMSGISQLAFSTTSPSLPDLSPPANPFLSASPSSSGTSKPFNPGSVLQNTSPSFSSFSQPKPNFFPHLPKLPGSPEPLVLPPPSKESDSLSGQVDSPTSIKTDVSAEYKPSRSERTYGYSGDAEFRFICPEHQWNQYIPGRSSFSSGLFRKFGK